MLPAFRWREGHNWNAGCAHLKRKTSTPVGVDTSLRNNIHAELPAVSRMEAEEEEEERRGGGGGGGGGGGKLTLPQAPFVSLSTFQRGSDDAIAPLRQQFKRICTSDPGEREIEGEEENTKRELRANGRGARRRRRGGRG